MNTFDNNYKNNQAEAEPDLKSLIQMKDITKVFHTGGIDFVALNNISVDFYAGEFVSVVGKSGSGKSTLANMLTGIDHPTQGSVTIAGMPIHNLKESSMSIWRGKNLGIVFQFYQLLSTLTLLENVMLPMDFCNTYPQTDREPRARDLLGMVSLAEFADMLPAAVSGGQQQSAAIARALANDPPILIADEPTTALDVTIQAQIMDLLTELNRTTGTAVLLISHDLGVVRHLCRRIYVMYAGKIVESGPTADILREPLHPYTQGLLASIPSIRKRNQRLSTIPGAVIPVDKRNTNGCLFRDRCPRQREICRTRTPESGYLDGTRAVACHLYTAGTH